MASNELPVVNVGEVVRDGLRLKTVEAVALVHALCAELDAGTAVAVPTSLDSLAVTDTGSVKVFHAVSETQPTRLAVAALLEQVLAAVTAEPGTVPVALRTLPERLRAAGHQDKTSDVKDLLSILRWHLPRDSREVLQDLFVRAKLSGTADHEEPAAIFAAEEPRLPAKTRFSPVWTYAAAAVLAFCIAGYSCYRFIASPMPNAQQAADAGTTAAHESVIADEAADPPAVAPRVIARPQRAEPRPVNLPVTGGAFSPSFTAEPRTLVFHAGHNSSGRLFTATLDDRGTAAELTPLFEEAARNYHARPSPDGRWIAFDSDREGERAVFVADRDGKQINRVSGNGFAAVPSWAPDMKTLAFVRAEPGRPNIWNLWMRDLASGQLSRATRFRSGQVWGASWFADSASYAYSHEDRLIIADRAGRQLTSFASPVRGRLVRTPAVSPDGREIVFQVYRDGAWIVDVKTGAMRRILDDATAEEFTWSPDGAQIAYHSRRDGEWRIWVMTP